MKPNGHDRNGGRISPSAERVEVLDFITLEGKAVPLRSWLVPDWIPIGKVTGLYGPAGDGKTLAAQMLMTASALGKPWLGFEVKPVRSLGIFCEDDPDDLHIRQHQINQFYGCSFAELEDMKALARLGHNNTLMDFEGNRAKRTPFFTQVRDVAQDFGAELILVDTAADVFGGNQNDANQTRQFVQHALGSLARDLGAALLLCAHPSKEGQRSGHGDSGSQQWDATFRSRLYLSRPDEGAEDPDQNARILTRKKANFAPRDETIKLHWQDHVFVRADQPSGIFASINHRSCEAVFLDLLEKSESQGRHVSASPNAANFAPKEFARRPKKDRAGFTYKEFLRAMEVQFHAGEIHNQEYGPASRLRSKIVRVSPDSEAPK